MASRSPASAASARSGSGWRTAWPVGGEHVDLGEERLLLGLDLTGALLEFFVREDVARAEPRRPLQRHAHHLDTRPEPLEIGVTPRRDRLNEARRRTGDRQCGGLAAWRGIGRRPLLGHGATELRANPTRR